MRKFKSKTLKTMAKMRHSGLMQGLLEAFTHL